MTGDPFERLRGLCDTAQNGWVLADDVRRVIAETGASLTLTEAEAGILLALIDRQPLPPGSLDALEAVTGRIHAIVPATGSHRHVGEDDDW